MALLREEKRRKVDRSEEEEEEEEQPIPSLRTLAKRCVDVEKVSAGDCAELQEKHRTAKEAVERLVTETQRLKDEYKKSYHEKWACWGRVKEEYEESSRSSQPRDLMLSCERLAELLEGEMPEMAAMMREAEFDSWQLWTAVEARRRKLECRRAQEAAAGPHEALLAELAAKQAHVDNEFANAVVTLATASETLASEQKLASRRWRWIVNTGAPPSREDVKKIDDFENEFRDCPDDDIEAADEDIEARDRSRRRHLPVLVDTITCCFCDDLLEPTSKAPRAPVALRCVNEKCRAFHFPFYRPGLRFCHMRDIHLALDGKPLMRPAGFFQVRKYHKFTPTECNVVFLHTEAYDEYDRPRSACYTCPPHVEAYFCRRCMPNSNLSCSSCARPHPQCGLSKKALATPDDTESQNRNWPDSSVYLRTCPICACLLFLGCEQRGEEGRCPSCTVNFQCAMIEGRNIDEF